MVKLRVDLKAASETVIGVRRVTTMVAHPRNCSSPKTALRYALLKNSLLVVVPTGETSGKSPDQLKEREGDAGGGVDHHEGN